MTWSGERIYRVHGPFLFGATDKLRIVAEQVDALPEIVVLRLRNMTALDATGVARDRGTCRHAARVGKAARPVRRASPARSAKVAKEILNRRLVGAHALLRELRRDRV